MDELNYTVVIEPADDDSYSVHVPDLPGCISTGDTKEEALANITEAIRGHVATLREMGNPIPEPKSSAAVVPLSA